MHSTPAAGSRQTRSATRLPRAPGLRAFAVAALSVLGLAACRGGGTEPTTRTIGKETFVSTYVALRDASLNVDTADLDSARTAILKRAGVTAQDMLTFVDVHGRDVAYMKDVWQEVEDRLKKSKPGGTTAR